MTAFLQAIIKWLIITLIVLTVVAVIMLGLGHMLAENEKETKAYKAQLDTQAQSEANSGLEVVSLEEYQRRLDEQEEVRKRLAKDITLLNNQEEAKKAIKEHVTCQDVSQCRLFDTQSIELGCVVAVNIIGYSKLDKLSLKKVSGCEENIDHAALACHRNTCSIQ